MEGRQSSGVAAVGCRCFSISRKKLFPFRDGEDWGYSGYVSDPDCENESTPPAVHSCLVDAVQQKLQVAAMKPNKRPEPMAVLRTAIAHH